MRRPHPNQPPARLRRPWLEPADHRPWSGPAPGAVVIVDTGSWGQLAEVRPWLGPLRERACVIDHHLHGDAEVASRRLIQTSAASCTEALAPLCAAIAGVRSPS